MVDTALNWWKGGLSPWVKLVYLVLIANGLPALIILMSLPGQTANWFVWTVNLQASAHLLGVMYGNALLLVVFGAMQPSWARARITLLVISIFSVVATIVTFLTWDRSCSTPGSTWLTGCQCTASCSSWPP